MRFLCFGYSSSRLTCASDSSPDIARNECPNAISIPISPSNAPALGAKPKRGSDVVCSGSALVAGGVASGNSRNAPGAILGNQPTASRLNARLCGAGEGGSLCASGLVRMLYPDHRINTTTITVVTYIIRSASSDDSCMPCVLRHQKYTVIRIANPAAM